MGKEILLLLVMFWNVENFFDPFLNSVAEESVMLASDTLKANAVYKDKPFTPQGEKFWTWRKFAKKRDDIAKTIALVKERYGIFPALIGLCEVENRFVLHQLVDNTLLSGLDYGIIHKDSPDRRGIDAALLYRKKEFRPLQSHFYSVGQEKEMFYSRDIVYVKGVFRNLDTLHCFVVHWPSRLGGEALSMPRRMVASNCLKRITDSIICSDVRANIIVMGDFNDEAASAPLKNLDNLINMTVREFEGIKRGKIMQVPQNWFTYKYKEKWERIDHFFVSENLFDENYGNGSLKWLFCSPLGSKVFCHEFLLEKDALYLGYKIRRTLAGPRYNGGVSDHLPIVLGISGYDL